MLASSCAVFETLGQPRAFALDPRLKTIERRGIAVNSIAMIRFSMSTTLAAIAMPLGTWSSIFFCRSVPGDEMDTDVEG